MKTFVNYVISVVCLLLTALCALLIVAGALVAAPFLLAAGIVFIAISGCGLIILREKVSD